MYMICIRCCCARTRVLFSFHLILVCVFLCVRLEGSGFIGLKPPESMCKNANAHTHIVAFCRIDEIDVFFEIHIHIAQCSRCTFFIVFVIIGQFQS